VFPSVVPVRRPSVAPLRESSSTAVGVVVQEAEVADRRAATSKDHRAAHG